MGLQDCYKAGSVIITRTYTAGGVVRSMESGLIIKASNILEEGNVWTHWKQLEHSTMACNCLTTNALPHKICEFFDYHNYGHI